MLLGEGNKQQIADKLKKKYYGSKGNAVGDRKSVTAND